MNRRAGFSVPLIIAIVLFVLVISGIATFAYITAKSETNLTSSAFSPATLDIKVPTPDSQTAGFKNAATPSATPTPTPTPTSTQTTPGTIKQISVTTALSSDQKTLTITFSSPQTFSGLTEISYTLTYTSDGGDRNAQGSFAPDTTLTSIQKTVTLGSCSTGSVCVYDANPHLFRLNVTTK